MLIGLVITCLSLLILYAGFEWKVKDLIVDSLFIYLAAFTMTVGPITWLYVPEIIQPGIVAYATMINWLSACLVVWVYPVARENSANKDVSWLYLLFSGCMLI